VASRCAEYRGLFPCAGKTGARNNKALPCVAGWLHSGYSRHAAARRALVPRRSVTQAAVVLGAPLRFDPLPSAAAKRPGVCAALVEGPAGEPRGVRVEPPYLPQRDTLSAPVELRLRNCAVPAVQADLLGTSLWLDQHYVDVAAALPLQLLEQVAAAAVTAPSAIAVAVISAAPRHEHGTGKGDESET
jgi:hypothetical protein